MMVREVAGCLRVSACFCVFLLVSACFYVFLRASACVCVCLRASACVCVRLRAYELQVSCLYRVGVCLM